MAVEVGKGVRIGRWMVEAAAQALRACAANGRYTRPALQLVSCSATAMHVSSTHARSACAVLARCQAAVCARESV